MNLGRKCEKIIGADNAFVDLSTGEMFETEGKSVYITTDEERQKRKNAIDKKNKEKLERQQINDEYKEYGGFVWGIYSIDKQLFPELKPSNITRLMFLSTYLTYHGYLAHGNNKAMTRKNMFDLLRLSEREFKSFYKNMFDNEIFYEEENKIYINKSLFSKGRLSQKVLSKFASQEKYITRLYVDGVRSLYEKSTPRSHKTLSYLFQVLPYVNRQYNIVCFNPLEERLEDIQGMSLGQFCETIGYSTTNSAKLFKYLFEPQFVIDGQVKTAMRYVVDRSLAKETYSMYINPRVYYAGNRWEQVEVLGKF